MSINSSFSQALSLATEIHDPSLAIKAYSGIAKNQIAAGQHDAAKQTFSQAIALSQTIEEHSRQVEVLIHIAKTQHAVEDIHSATSTFAQAEQVAKKIPDDFLKTIALVDIGKIQKSLGITNNICTHAASLTHKVKPEFLRCSALIYVANMQIYNQDRVVAQSTFLQAREIASHITDPYFRCTALASVAEAWEPHSLYHATRTFNQAISSALAIEDDSNRILVLCSIAITLHTTGNKPKAQLLFAHALTDTHQLEDLRLRITTLAHVAQSQTKIGHTSEATKTFQLAIEFAEELETPYFYAEALSYLAKIQQNTGSHTSAEETLEQLSHAIQGMESIDDRNAAYSAMVENLAQSDHMEEAIDTANNITDPHLRATALLEISHISAKNNDTETAYYLLSQALSIPSEQTQDNAESRHDHINYSESISHIAEAHIRDKEFSRAVNTSTHIYTSKVRAFILLDIAKAQFRQKQSPLDTLQLACEATALIQDPSVLSQISHEINQLKTHYTEKVDATSHP